MASVLLTGGSSFTGLGIAEALVAAGHQVTAPLARSTEVYEPLRRDRAARLAKVAEVVPEHPLDSQAFRELARSRRFDLFACHGADIRGYRQPDYDPQAGVARNLAGAEAALEILAAGGLRAVVVTGTVFEPGEGGAAAGEPAVSPYGLSKGLTNQAWREMARSRGLAFTKFVIANPFGPMEQGRFVWSLFQNWCEGRAGLVRTPNYVRDNLPVPLLAQAYARLASDLLAGRAADRIARPSGYIAPQGLFALKVATEAARRLGRDCALELAIQPTLSEPYVRANSEPCLLGDWGEPAFWDAYVAYYEDVAARGLLGSAPA